MEATLGYPLIAIGVGNTSVQFALFEEQGSNDPLPLPSWQLSRATGKFEPGLFDEVEVPQQVARVAIASVNRIGFEQTHGWIQRRWPNVQVKRLVNTDFPVKLGQTHPERVGTDRVAGATASNALREADRCAVFVDAGTALTVNAIDRQGTFLGGAILPGIGVSLSSLSHHTDQLPELGFSHLLDAQRRPSIGRTTQDAIRSGVFWGAVGAIRELKSRMAQELDSQPQTFVTGGFGKPLADALGTDAQFVPHLVLSGIAIASRQ